MEKSKQKQCFFTFEIGMCGYSEINGDLKVVPMMKRYNQHNIY